MIDDGGLWFAPPATSPINSSDSSRQPLYPELTGTCLVSLVRSSCHAGVGCMNVCVCLSVQVSLLYEYVCVGLVARYIHIYSRGPSDIPGA